MRRLTALVAVIGFAALLTPSQDSDAGRLRLFVPPPDDCDAICGAQLATCTQGVRLTLEACLLGGEDPRACVDEAKSGAVDCELEAEACFAACEALALEIAATPAQVGPECTPVITKIQRFSAGAGALRNTSTDGEQTRGSSKTKSVTVVVALTCTEPATRLVTVDLTSQCATSPFCNDGIVSEFSRSLPISDGRSARFKFSFSYNKTSCANGEGPIPKDQGGVNQVNEPGFTFFATARTDDAGDPSDAAQATAVLTCKPSRTTATGYGMGSLGTPPAEYSIASVGLVIMLVAGQLFRRRRR